jgi:hypothetical protein
MVDKQEKQMAKRKQVDAKAIAKIDESSQRLLSHVRPGAWADAIKIAERLDRNDEARRILAKSHR